VQNTIRWVRHCAEHNGKKRRCADLSTTRGGMQHNRGSKCAEHKTRTVNNMKNRDVTSSRTLAFQCSLMVRCEIVTANMRSTGYINGSRLGVGSGEFVFHLPRRKTDLTSARRPGRRWNSTAAYIIGKGGSFPGGKTVDARSYRSPPSSAEAKNGSSFVHRWSPMSL
jgi:hypothetical protein